MIVDNQTPHSTRELRRLALIAYTAVRKHEGKMFQWGRVKLRFIRAKKWVSGYAYVGGTLSVIRVPKVCHKQRLVKVLAHEIFHLYGYRHENFCDHGLYDWLPEVPGLLEPPAPKVTPAVDRQRERYERVLELEKAWLRKQKLAVTKLRSLRERRKYYEKALAASVMQKEVQDEQGPSPEAE